MFEGRELGNLNVGIIGMGNIGYEVAKSSYDNYCLQHFKSIESNKVCIQIPTENVVITI